MADSPRVSVVVPTHSRVEGLRRCLAALEKQTVPIEIVVVHDGDQNAPAVDALTSDAGAILVRQPNGGVASARNTGIAKAPGDFILFTDDDCEPAPDWAERLAAALATHEFVAGGVVNALPADPYATATQEIHYHLMDDPDAGFATPNNVGARRQVYLDVPFDEDFAMAGGEDREWCARVQEAGYNLTRAPEAKVLHWQEFTGRSFVRKHFEYGRGSARFRATSGVRRHPVSWYAALVRRGFAHNARTGVLIGVAQAVGVAGALVEVRAAKRDGQAAVAAGPPAAER